MHTFLVFKRICKITNIVQKEKNLGDRTLESLINS